MTSAANNGSLAFLESAARRELEGCRVVAHDGTVLFTPDGQGHYRALWTRDFAYMVEGAGDLIDPAEIRAAILYLLRGQRADGCVPDRVQADGRPVYSAGAAHAPLGEPPTDNAQFMVLLVHETVRRTGDLDLARQSLPALRRALDHVPRSAGGLVHIPHGQRQSPYGFTDTVAKTGELLFSSLLYWEACVKMASLCASDRCSACDKDERSYRQRAEAVERGLDRLWDPQAGAYRAATGDNALIDVWGSAYAVYNGCARGERRERLLVFLRDHYKNYAWRGQVRHLLQADQRSGDQRSGDQRSGEHWERLLIPVEPGTYQNGAYWATASGWVLFALAQIDLPLARSMFAELIQDFRENGICECVNVGYRKLEHYVVSAVNPLGALRRVPELVEGS
jgi:hypothetical protein